MKKILSILILLIITCILTACGCEHQWIDANCTDPKSCTQCDAIEGEPLGHSWIDAICTLPKTCSVCNATEGEALGHLPGQWQETAKDYVNALVSEACLCDRCGETADTRERPMDNFADEEGTKFMISAEDLVRRIETAYNLINAEQNRQFRIKLSPMTGIDIYMLTVHDNETFSAVIGFFASVDTLEIVSADNTDGQNITTVVLQLPGENEAVLHFTAVALAIDPAITNLTQATECADAIFDCCKKKTKLEQNGISYAESLRYASNIQIYIQPAELS